MSLRSWVNNKLESRKIKHQKKKDEATKKLAYLLWEEEGKQQQGEDYYWLKAQKKLSGYHWFIYQAHQTFIKRKQVLLWLAWDLSGLRFICSKITPKIKQDRKREPSTFLLWFLSLHFAMFGLASSRYENRKDVLENKLSIITAQLTTDARQGAFRRLINIQKQEIPLSPNIFNPLRNFKSFFVQKTDTDILIQTKEIIESEKNNLNGIDLTGIDLTGFDLTGFDFSDANLRNANLTNADLSYAELRNTYLRNASLTGIYIHGND